MPTISIRTDYVIDGGFHSKFLQWYHVPHWNSICRITDPVLTEYSMLLDQRHCHGNNYIGARPHSTVSKRTPMSQRKNNASSLPVSAHGIAAPWNALTTNKSIIAMPRAISIPIRLCCGKVLIWWWSHGHNWPLIAHCRQLIVIQRVYRAACCVCVCVWHCDNHALSVLFVWIERGGLDEISFGGESSSGDNGCHGASVLVDNAWRHSLMFDVRVNESGEILEMLIGF